MKLLTTKQIVVRVIVIISLTEFLIMLILGIIPHGHSTYSEAILDVAMLVVFSTPLLYIWIIKQLIRRCPIN